MPAISTLGNIARSSIATLSAISAGGENQFSRDVVAAVNNLNSVVADLEKRYASATPPIDQPAGKRYYDTTNQAWKGYKTALGTPVTFLDTSTAYQQSLSTGGNGTFKLGGPLDVNTTASTGSSIPAVMQSYTVPANTMAADGAAIAGICFGTGRAFDINFGPTIHTVNTLSSGSKFAYKVYAVRKDGATQKFGAAAFKNSDAEGITSIVKTGTVSNSAAGAIAFSNVRESGTTQSEVLLTKLIP